MKKRPDEKLNLLSKIGSYHINLDMLESMYFKLINKKQTIVLWLHYPKKDSNVIQINEYHEVRTEKDIVRYLTSVVDQMKKRTKTVDDKRKMCIMNLKNKGYTIVNPLHMLEKAKHKLNQILSIHFLDNSLQMQQGDPLGTFTYYCFGLYFNDDSVDPA